MKIGRNRQSSPVKKNELPDQPEFLLKKYSGLLEAYPFAVIEINGEDVTYSSDEARKILGLQKSGTPDSLHSLFSDARKILNIPLPSSVILHPRKKKSPVELRQLIVFARRNCIYEIRKEAKKKGAFSSEPKESAIDRTREWQQSEARLSLLMQSVPIAFYSFEKGNRKTIWYSEQIEYLTGFPPDEFRKDYQFWVKRIKKDDYAIVGGTFDKLTKPNQRVACEYRWIDARGQEIWILDQAVMIEASDTHPEQIIGCFMDISERKMAEIAIIESEKNYREIFNSAHDAILIHSAKTGKIEDVNETMFKMYGITYEEALNLDFDQFSLGKPPYNKEHALKKIEQALIKGKEEFEWLGRRKDGSLFWTYIILKVIILNNEAKVMAIVRDIDQKKKADEQLIYRSAFEKLILDISSRFINISYLEVETGIEHALREIADFVKVSAAYLFLYDDLDNTVNLKYLFQNKKVNITREQLEHVPINKVDWHAQKIRKQEVVQIGNTSEIPEEGSELRKMIMAQNVHAFVDVPLIYQNSSIGFLGLALEKSGREWLEDEIALLKITGQIFVNAILRKQSAQTLHESEQAHREIYNATSEAIIIHDMETGQFLDVNNAMLEMFGYTYDEALKTGLGSISSGENGYTGDNALNLIHKTLEKGPQVIEWRARRKDKSLFWVEIVTKSAEIQGNKRVLSVIRDISDRKKAEEELKENEEKYRLLVESQTDLVIKIDTNGNFLFVSPSYCELFGKTEQELLGRKYMPLVHEDDQATTLEAMGKLHKPPHTCYIEQRALTKNGWRWIAWSNKAILNAEKKVVEIIGVGRDMTYQKGVEEALRRSEDRFRSIVQHLSDIVFICDKENNIVYDTPSIYSILGYNEGFMVGQNFLSLIYPEDIPIAKKKFSSILNDGNNTVKAELRIKNQKGEWIHMEAIAINLLRHPSIKGIVITLRDISERKMIDKKILDAVIKTEEQERDRFAKNLHDDLGPLLSSLKMYIGSLGTARDEKKMEFIISQLNEVVKEAITTTKEVSNDLSPHILINYGLVSAIENFIKKVPSGIEVDFNSSLTSERYSNSIENSFYRIIKELINNTLKHANSSKISINLEENGQELLLSYQDDGKGMDLNNLGSENIKGMGLSNIISRAKSLNGKYHFESQKGHGFSFTISIPIHQTLD